MAELQPVHRYAAGALLGLALHQAQVHQCSLPHLPDEALTESQQCSIGTEHEERSVSLWTSQDAGLLRPIFRFLKIDAIAWVGLEQTALSTDATDHIKAFLRILSDEEDHETTSNTAEVKLTEAVDELALKLENVSSSDGRNLKGHDGHSETLDPGEPQKDTPVTCIPETDTSKNGTPGALCHSNSSKFDPYKSPEKFSMVREDYFSIAPSTVAEKDPGLSQGHTEPLGSTESTSRSEVLGKPESSVDCHEHLLDSTSPRGSLIVEGSLPTSSRKVAVLFELLSAVVADLPADDEEKKSKTRRGYDARQRVAIRLLATWLDVKWNKVAAMEILVAYAAMAAQEDAEENNDENTKAVKRWAKWKRGGLIGAAAVTGGALLALTGGLAAPAIAAGLSALAPTLGTIVPVIGSAGFTAAATAAGTTVGSVAVAASFGAAGAGLTGAKMARRTGGVEEFGFEGLGENHQQGRLAVGIAISGFLNSPEDFTRPWRGKDADLEMYALRWETKNLMAVSTAIQDWLTSNIANELMKQGAMLTVLSTLISALAWPSALLSLTSFIDSKWSIAVDRSDKAGKLLADVLLKGLQGNRPVILMGFSLGARVIFKCLETLAEKGENGRIVERVVLLGAPLSREIQKWETVRKVVAGRFINAYSTNDWMLGVVYRASLMSQGLAGIQPVDVPGIENIDVTDVINGHSSYLSSLQEILQGLDLDNYFPCSGKLKIPVQSS